MQSHLGALPNLVGITTLHHAVHNALRLLDIVQARIDTELALSHTFSEATRDAVKDLLRQPLETPQQQRETYRQGLGLKAAINARLAPVKESADTLMNQTNAICQGPRDALQAAQPAIDDLRDTVPHDTVNALQQEAERLYTPLAAHREAIVARIDTWRMQMHKDASLDRLGLLHASMENIFLHGSGIDPDALHPRRHEGTLPDPRRRAPHNRQALTPAIS